MLKVLFVNNFGQPDYLANSIYIGLNLDENIEIHTYCVPAHLFKNIGWNEEIETNSKYPLITGYPGYFLSGKIEKAPYIDTPMKIIKKIEEKFYDKIIWGSIWRDRQYLWDAVNAGYKKEDMIALDGEDFQDGLDELFPIMSYFKREIYEDLENENIFPITFGIPDFLLLKDIPEKTQTFATVIPDKPETYIFHNEEDYLNDYKKSFFGNTKKKGGWDCLRHYEMLSRRCLPFFLDIEKCPKKTLVNFPKELIKYTNTFAEKGHIPPDYESINKEIYDHCLNNLTCSQLVKQIFL